MPVRTLLVCLAAAALSADAFTPVTRARAVRHSRMYAETEDAPAGGDGIIVPVSDDNVKTTVGIAGAAVGFSVAGPVGAAVAAAAANYASKKVRSPSARGVGGHKFEFTRTMRCDATRAKVLCAKGLVIPPLLEWNRTVRSEGGRLDGGEWKVSGEQLGGLIARGLTG